MFQLYGIQMVDDILLLSVLLQSLGKKHWGVLLDVETRHRMKVLLLKLFRRNTFI
jgi:hypothetical protein